MIAETAPDNRNSGRLAENIVYFARGLRRAGILVGPAAVIDAISAVEIAGVAAREDFYWTLHSIFVSKREHHAVFDEAFRLFWRRQQNLEMMLSGMLDDGERIEKNEKPPPGAMRA